MAALPANNTQRWFYDYTQGSYTHTLMVRGRTATTTADVDADVADLLSDIGGEFIEGTIVGVRYSAAGSDVSFPVASDRLGDSFGSGTATAYHSATYMGFVGRDPAGHRARVYIFGYKNALGNYRLKASDSTPVQNAVNTLNAFGSGFDSIAGASCIWNAYANLGVNDHWEVKARG